MLTSKTVLNGDDLLGAQIDFVLIHRYDFGERVGWTKKVTARIKNDQLTVLVALASTTI